MKSAVDQIWRQFLRFHFGRWTPRDDSNPIESWQRAKHEAWNTLETQTRDSLQDPSTDRSHDGDTGV